MNFILGTGVQVAGGFVGEENGGGVDEGAGNGDALLLTAGEFRGLVRGAAAEAYEVEEVVGLPAGLAGAGSADESRDHHVLQGGKLRQQVMGLEHKADATVTESGKGVSPEGKDVGSVDGEGAGIGGEERAQDLEKGGLAGAGSAHNGDDLPGAGPEVYSLEHFHGAKGLLNMGCLYHGRGDKTRTCDPLVPNQMRLPTALHPVEELQR